MRTEKLEDWAEGGETLLEETQGLPEPTEMKSATARSSSISKMRAGVSTIAPTCMESGSG